MKHFAIFCIMFGFGFSALASESAPSSSITPPLRSMTSHNNSLSDPPKSYDIKIRKHEYAIRTNPSAATGDRLSFARLLATCQHILVNSMYKRYIAPSTEIATGNWACHGKLGEMHFASESRSSGNAGADSRGSDGRQNDTMTTGQKVYPFDYFEVSSILYDFDTLAQRYADKIPAFEFSVYMTDRAGAKVLGVNGYWLSFSHSSAVSLADQQNSTLETE